MGQIERVAELVDRGLDGLARGVVRVEVLDLLLEDGAALTRQIATRVEHDAEQAIQGGLLQPQKVQALLRLGERVLGVLHHERVQLGGAPLARRRRAGDLGRLSDVATGETGLSEAATDRDHVAAIALEGRLVADCGLVLHLQAQGSQRLAPPSRDKVVGDATDNPGGRLFEREGHVRGEGLGSGDTRAQLTQNDVAILVLRHDLPGPVRRVDRLAGHGAHRGKPGALAVRADLEHVGADHGRDSLVDPELDGLLVIRSCVAAVPQHDWLARGRLWPRLGKRWRQTVSAGLDLKAGQGPHDLRDGRFQGGHSR